MNEIKQIIIQFYYKNLSHQKFKINYEHEIDSFKDELGVSLGRVKKKYLLLILLELK